MQQHTDTLYNARIVADRPYGTPGGTCAASTTPAVGCYRRRAVVKAGRSTGMPVTAEILGCAAGPAQFTALRYLIPAYGRQPPALPPTPPRRSAVTAKLEL